MRTPAPIIAPEELQPATAGPKRAADDVEEGGLAGAVGADQRMNMSLGHDEADIAQSLIAAEMPADRAELQERAHRRRPRGAPINPSGRQIATITRRLPKTVMRQS